MRLLKQTWFQFLVLTTMALGAFNVVDHEIYATRPVVADEQQKVVICHRHNSVTSPYNQEEVSANAVDGEGNNDHAKHTGPVATSEAAAQSLKDNQEKWGDIIPNILNWTAEGIAVYNNQCKYPELPPVEEEPPVDDPEQPVDEPDFVPTDPTSDQFSAPQGK